MTQQEIDKHFNTLYTNYYYTKVRVEDGFLVYHSIPFGHNETMREEIEEKIRQLNLPLYVEPNSTNGVFQDTILIKPVLNNY